MKNLILLLSVLMIAGVATARRSGHGSRKEKRYKSESRESCGESLEKHERKRNRYEEHKGDGDGCGEGEVQERKRNRHKKHKGDRDGERRLTQEQLEQRIRRMAKGNEAEYNRLLQLSKDDPKAFRKEARSRRVARSKNRGSKNKRGE